MPSCQVSRFFLLRFAAGVAASRMDLRIFRQDEQRQMRDIVQIFMNCSLRAIRQLAFGACGVSETWPFKVMKVDEC